MGLFKKKPKQTQKEEYDSPIASVKFNDGSTILAANPQVTTRKVTHRDGRMYQIMMFDVSNYAKEGETLYVSNMKKVVVEKELNPDGTCDGLTKDEMRYYAAQYVDQVFSGLHQDPSKICRYIGRYDPNSSKMIISPTVQQNFIDSELEPTIRAELEAKYAEKRAIDEARAAKEREEFLAKAAQENKAFLDREARIRQQRLASGRFELVRGSKDGRDDNYDGVDLISGDVLRVRNLCKVGKDIETNVYLYTANVSTTHNETDVELLTANEKVIAFATKVKIDQLAQTPAGKRKALEIFTKGNKEAEYGGGLKFIGNFDENAELISERLDSCPESIQNSVASISQKIEVNQNRINDSFRKANQRSGEDRDR